jgi:glycosyltransferase involved in cell wall biosynthesis
MAICIRFYPRVICVWVNKRDWRQPGPIVNVGIRNAYALAALGRETHFFVGAGAASETASDLREFYGLDANPDLHIHRVARTALLARWGLRPGETSSGPIFRRAARFIRASVRKDVVAVITRDASFLPYLVWLKSRFGPRLLGFYEAHDFHVDLAWRRAWRLPVKSQDVRQSWLERLLLPRLDGLICITAAQRDLFAARQRRLAICALPLGTDPVDAPVDPEVRRALRRAVYIGRLSRGKGRDLLLAAAPQLARAGIKLAFWGGNSDQAAALRRQAADQGLGTWVEVVGSRPPDELHRDLNARASLGLAPLADDAYNRYLTCPVKALDYLSHSLPVIASDLPSTREVLGDQGAGRFVPPGDADSLARAIIAVIDDASAYAAATHAAHARACTLAWSKRGERLLAFIECQHTAVTAEEVHTANAANHGDHGV